MKQKEFKLIKNDDKEMIIDRSNYLNNYVHQIVLEKAKLLDQYVYSNMETEKLKAMKHLIDAELFNRSLHSY